STEGASETKRAAPFPPRGLLSEQSGSSVSTLFSLFKSSQLVPPAGVLFPLNGAGRFGTDVVDYSGDTRDFVHDPGRNTFQDVPWEANPIGSHRVFGFHNPDSHGQAIRAAVAHNADAA